MMKNWFQAISIKETNKIQIYINSCSYKNKGESESEELVFQKLIMSLDPRENQ